MTRQYIGARYVPRFFENSQGGADWESGVAYEALTIVTYNGNSYTSKKTVPATIGNPSQNPSYWASTGIYNQQVEDLRQQFVQLSEDVDGYAERLRVAENDITDLGDRVSILDSRKVIFIGDSFCDGGLGGYVNGVFTRFCTFAGLTAGTDAFLFAKGGAGMVGAGQGLTFSDLVDQAIAAHSSDADSISDVMIAGGSNDCDYETSAINSAKDALFAKIRTAFPNARIFIACFGGFMNPTRRELLYSRVRYVYTYRPSAGVIPIINAHLPLLNPVCFATDGIHPTAEGCTEIGECLATAFREISRTGCMTNTYGAYVTLPAANGVSNALQMIYSHDTEKITLQIRGNMGFNLTDPVQIAFNIGATIKVASVEMAGGIVVPNVASVSDYPRYQRMPVTVLGFKTNSEGWREFPAEFLTVANENNIDWYIRIITGTYPGTYSTFRIPPCTIDVM